MMFAVLLRVIFFHWWILIGQKIVKEEGRRRQIYLAGSMRVKEGAEEHVQRCQRGFLSTGIVITPNTPLPCPSNPAIGVDRKVAGRAATSPACRAATWWAGVAPCGSWRWDVTLPVPRAVHFCGEDVGGQRGAGSVATEDF